MLACAPAGSRVETIPVYVDGWSYGLRRFDLIDGLLTRLVDGTMANVQAPFSEFGKANEFRLHFIYPNLLVRKK